MAKKFVLSNSRDPFNITKGREMNAYWAKRIFDEIVTPHMDKQGINEIHIRDIHYIYQGLPDAQRANGEPYINDDKCWNSLVDAFRDCRYLNLIDATRIKDNKNELKINAYQHSHYDLSWKEDSVKELFTREGLIDKGVANYLTLINLSKLQPYIVEFWVEKELPIVTQVADKYSVVCNQVIGEGEIALTQVLKLVDRARLAEKPVRIGYLGDCDVIGMNMAKAMARKLEFYCHKYPELDVKVTRLFLTPEQVKEYQLPIKPMKKSKNKGYETRKQNFYEKYDILGAVELNTMHSLQADDFRKLLEEFILQFYDPEIAESARRLENQVRKYVRGVLEQAIPEFEAEAIDLSELNGLYQPEQIKSSWPYFEEEKEWLFDSKRSQKEQFDAYFNQN